MPDLIRPVRSGPALAEEIRSARPGPGALAVWWLGQSGFVVKSRLGTLAVDPYLSEHLTRKYEGTSQPHVRMTACPIRPGELAGLDLVLATHKHSDHMDPGTLPGLLDANPAAVLVVPASLEDHARSLGLPGDRLAGLEAGGAFERAGFRVRAVPSAHEGLDTDARGRHLYLGYLIEADGRRLYHTGDTVRYDGLEAWLGPDRLDATFLPINGRDPARGVAGNMSAGEAVDFAAGVRPRFVVPHHFDMFTFNTVPVAAFEAEAARLPEGVEPRVLRCGERWEIRP
jgi:L-ascorbate metabolism protein UlaG (beta-lactamase superfamily)